LSYTTKPYPYNNHTIIRGGRLELFFAIKNYDGVNFIAINSLIISFKMELISNKGIDQRIKELIRN
jgi:hypothetical protein